MKGQRSRIAEDISRLPGLAYFRTPGSADPELPLASCRFEPFLIHLALSGPPPNPPSTQSRLRAASHCIDPESEVGTWLAFTPGVAAKLPGYSKLAAAPI